MNRASFYFLSLLFAGILAAGASEVARADSAKIWMGHSQQFEEFLENAEIVSVKELGIGANNPKKVTLKRDNQVLAGKRPLPPCSRYVASEASFVCAPLEAGDEGGKRCGSEGQRGYRK